MELKTAAPLLAEKGPMEKENEFFFLINSFSILSDSVSLSLSSLFPDNGGAACAKTTGSSLGIFW